MEGYAEIHDRSDKEEPDANAAGECVGKQSKECTGDLCSKHGIAFAVCLARSVPIKNVSIAKVAKEGVFVDRELEDMANNHKRFLLYVVLLLCNKCVSVSWEGKSCRTS